MSREVHLPFQLGLLDDDFLESGGAFHDPADGGDFLGGSVLFPHLLIRAAEFGEEVAGNAAEIGRAGLERGQLAFDFADFRLDIGRGLGEGAVRVKCREVGGHFFEDIF